MIPRAEESWMPFQPKQALRQEAIRRRLAGEKHKDICKALKHSPRWFDRWWRIYQDDPDTRLADRSPQQCSSDVERMIVSIRRVCEAGRSAETKYGFLGARTIQGDVQLLGFNPPPSLSKI
jgi:hypothetical protein